MMVDQGFFEVTCSDEENVAGEDYEHNSDIEFQNSSSDAEITAQIPTLIDNKIIR